MLKLDESIGATEYRRLAALLIAATAVGACLRAAFVGSPSLNYEEIFTHAIVTKHTLSGVWNAVNSSESTPPLYYLLTWGWLKLFGGGGAASLRIISLLAGCLSVPVSFFAVRRFVGNGVALAVAWLAAVSPLLVNYSIYARSYGLLVLVGALSLWALAAVLERPSPRTWALWALAAAGCLWTHYFAGFLIAGELAVLGYRLRAHRRAIAISVAGILILTAPLWPLFLSQSGASDRTAYIAATPLLTRLENGVRQYGMGNIVPATWFEALGLAVVLLGLAAALLLRDGRRALIVPAVVFVVAAALPILLAASGIEDKLLARNLLGAWICLAPIAAYGLTRLRAVPLLAYLVISLVAVLVVQTNWRYQGTTNWAAASAHLAGRATGQPIVVIPGIDVSVGAYYLHRRQLLTPLVTSEAWVVVEPIRHAGQRGLAPVAHPPIATVLGVEWHSVGEIDIDGFRMIHERTSGPVRVAPVPPNLGPAGSPTALILAPGAPPASRVH